MNKFKIIREMEVVGSYLGVSIHLEGVGVGVGLVAAGGRRVDVSHHGGAVARRQHRRRQRLLQLLLLFPVLGPSVLKPHLHQLQKKSQ